MPTLFDLLEKQSDPAVRAVLGHWLFGYIHPYPDGNGRMARFLMNAMLASSGYAWTVIRVEDRDASLASFDRAGIDADIAFHQVDCETSAMVADAGWDWRGSLRR